MSNGGVAARSVLKQSFGYGLAQFSGPVLQYLFVPIYSRVLSIPDYGQVFLMVTVAGVFELICKFSINIPMVRLYYEQKDESARRRFIGTFLWLQLGYNLLLIVSAMLAAPQINALIGNADHPRAFLVLSLLAGGLRALNNLPANVLRIREDVRGYGLLVGGTNVLQKVATLAAITVFNAGLIGYFWALLATSALSFLVSAGLMLRWGGFFFDSALARVAFALAFPMGLTNMLSWATNLSDRIILNRHFDSAAVAIYSMGYQFGFILTYVDTALYTAFSPTFYRRSRESGDGPALVTRFATYFFLAAAALAALISGCSRELILVFATHDYLPSRVVIPIVAAAYAVNQMFTFTGLIAVEQKRPGRLTWVFLTAASVNFGLNVLLIPKYGYIAAAWSTMAATVVNTSLGYCLTARAYPIRIEMARFAKISFAALLTGAAGWFASHGHPAMLLAVKAIALPALLVGVLFALRFFTQVEKAWAAGLLRRLRAAGGAR
jgi:O-antigen/teichoic acid export membrane protein